ncbi:toll/interleukin-1 receptor domain-containing protein [Methanofollis formosanus]|uniref:Toll/interleukin-1 receptor domain-containing protein n=1 Tax=Methanofollis formosanus TaxID=299308 RepID=A0A8G1A080_9EURY|nr:toll/interleukin-1 receptor domain-containing protein [Methanofollis formosanus]QYZ78078.1 toll/interleukin-1 receptor domain-containing protein [Methanofollis formosanus]
MPHDVFISYSSIDKAVADAVCHLLEERKIRCWIAPRDVPPGTPYARALVEAIGDAKAMVLIFSSNACNSEHVMRELEQASKRHVVVIPFRIEDAVPTPEMDYHISRIHWIDALTPPVEDHIHKLADHLANTLGIGEAPQSLPEEEAGRRAGKNYSGLRREPAGSTGLTGQRPVKTYYALALVAIVLLAGVVGLAIFSGDTNTNPPDSGGSTVTAGTNADAIAQAGTTDWEEVRDRGLDLFAQGDLDDALALFKEQEQICRKIGDNKGIADSLGNQGLTLARMGDLDGAMALYKGQERVCRETVDKAGLAKSLGNQGSILMARSNPDGAMELFQTQERYSRESGDQKCLAQSLDNQAQILLMKGDRNGAMALCTEAEEICRNSGDKAGLAASLGTQSLIECTRGNDDDALALCKEQEKISREIGDREELAKSLGNQAFILWKKEDYDGARALCTEQEKICREIQDARGRARSLGIQGLILLYSGENGALPLFKEQEQICRNIGDPQGEADAVGNQGVVLLNTGDPEGAMIEFKKHERLCKDLGYQEGLMYSLWNQAYLMAYERGDPGNALPLIEEAYRIASSCGMDTEAEMIQIKCEEIRALAGA